MQIGAEVTELYPGASAEAVYDPLGKGGRLSSRDPRCWIIGLGGLACGTIRDLGEFPVGSALLVAPGDPARFIGQRIKRAHADSARSDGCPRGCFSKHASLMACSRRTRPALAARLAYSGCRRSPRHA